MNGRSAILSRIRTSLGAKVGDPGRQDRVKARLADAPAGLIPARGQIAQPERIELFSTMAVKAAATVERAESYGDLPAAVTRYLREKNLPAVIRMGSDPRLASAPWAEEATLEVLSGATDGHDLVGVSHAVAGIAETATLALAAGPENPTTLNFLPEYHIVAVAAKDIVGDMEAVWGRLRQIYGKGTMPRVVNYVTGPSRSADIEQTILLGAHGPRALHIVIIG